MLRVLFIAWNDDDEVPRFRVVDPMVAASAQQLLVDEDAELGFDISNVVARVPVLRIETALKGEVYMLDYFLGSPNQHNLKLFASGDEAHEWADQRKIDACATFRLQL